MLFASLLTPAQRSALAEAFGDLDRRDRAAEHGARRATQAGWLHGAVTPEERLFIAAEVAHLDHLADIAGAR